MRPRRNTPPSPALPDGRSEPVRLSVGPVLLVAVLALVSFGLVMGLRRPPDGGSGAPSLSKPSPFLTGKKGRPSTSSGRTAVVIQAGRNMV